MALRVLGSDDDLEVRLQTGEPVERQLHAGAPLRGDDAQAPALRPQARQYLDDLPERLQLVVQRLVVLAIRRHELIDALRVEISHLRVRPGPPTAAGKHRFRNVALEHGLRGVPHRGDDHRPRVDQRAVEVEQADGKAHALIVAGPEATRGKGSRSGTRADRRCDGHHRYGVDT